MRADNFNGIIVHLNHRDVTMIAVSRASYSKLAAYKKRMGWNFKWVSSCDTDFNFRRWRLLSSVTYKVGFLTTLVLCVLMIATAGYFFVKGYTVPSTDSRIAVALTEAERDQILAEMRQLLKAVHGVLDGIVAQDLSRAERSARTVGMAMAVDVSPVIMAKLPLTFKAMGMSVHRDFDALADGIQSGEHGDQVMRRLSAITGRCTACHDGFRFATSP